MKENIINAIKAEEYQKAEINSDGIDVYFSTGKKKFKVIILLDTTVEMINYTKFCDYRKQIINSFEGVSEGKTIECLSVVLCEDGKQDSMTSFYSAGAGIDDSCNMCIIDTNDKELFRSAKVNDDFEKVVENISLVLIGREDKVIDLVQKKEEMNNPGRTNKKKTRYNRYGYQQPELSHYLKMSVVHIAIINIIIFLIIDFGMGIFFQESYESILDKGAANWGYIVDNGQIYRLITCMFLHQGMDHLSGNMISLLIMGIFLEELIGRKKLLFIYFSTGIIAGLTSISYNMLVGQTQVTSVGASGAIFGLNGALIALLVILYNRKEAFSAKRLIIYTALSLYTGFRGENVDNAAHVGGLVSGIVITAIIFYVIPMIRKNIGQKN